MSNKSSDLKQRTKLFAHQSVKLALKLPKDDLGSHIRKQLIRSSTSVAANYRATSFAQSKDAFIAKLSIVLEKAELVNLNELPFLKAEASELTAIFAKSRLTARENKK